MVAVQMQDDLRRVLDDEGKLLQGVKVPQLSEDTLGQIFDVMLMVRVMDDRMMRLQRQGQRTKHASGNPASERRHLERHTTPLVDTPCQPKRQLTRI